MIGLVHLSQTKHVIETRKCFGSACIYYNTADRAVETMHCAQEYFTRLRILLFDVRLYGICQCGIARLVALHDFASGFVYNDNMIVFVKYFHESVSGLSDG